MTQIVTINPAYSQIVICDPTAKVQVPIWKDDLSIIATDSCILCTCYPEQDGKTEVRFGPGNQSQPDQSLKFDGKLRTPGRTIAIETVEGDPVLNMQTARTEVRVRIWTNSIQWPDKVSVGID